MRSIYTVLCCMFLLSCKKFIQVEPDNQQIVASQAFSSDETAVSAISGVYHDMISTNSFANGSASSILQLAGLSADELIPYSEADADKQAIQFLHNAIRTDNELLYNPMWSSLYKTIYQCNAILSALPQSDKVSASVKEQVLGEAKFVRAFCHFYLTGLFKDVPLITTTSYTDNAKVSPSTQEQVYAQILKDLLEAKDQIAENYMASGWMVERVRPNRSTVHALLARTYLYMGNWADAARSAELVINNNTLYQLQPDPGAVFTAASTEAIWQLKPVLPGYNTMEGYSFVVTGDAPAPANYILRPALIHAFEAGDLRKDNWVGVFGDGYYPYKYKVHSGDFVSEYSMILRLSEQYLIAAEARIRDNDIAGGIAHLNTLRSYRRAEPSIAVPDPLPVLDTDMTEAQAMMAVEKERHVELFTEWGHRWFDLKRWPSVTTAGETRADDVLKPLKGANWQKTDILYPFPKREVDMNPRLRPQKDGY